MTNESIKIDYSSLMSLESKLEKMNTDIDNPEVNQLKEEIADLKDDLIDVIESIKIDYETASNESEMEEAEERLKEINPVFKIENIASIYLNIIEN